MKTGTVLVILILVVQLAGCSGNGNSKKPESPSSSQSGPPSPEMGISTTPNEVAPTAPLANNSIAFSQCSAFEFAWTIPPAANPGARPPEWGPSESLIAGIGLLGYQCQRVSLGPFERGPIRFLFESHSGAAFPPECDREATPEMATGIAATTWVDDQEVATYLNVTYGIQAIFSAIDVAQEPVSGVGQSTWTWGQQGQEKSELTIRAPDPVERRITGQMTFWESGAGLVRLFVNSEFDTAAGFANGMLKPPMLMAQVAGGAYAGYGMVYPMGDGQGEFTVYRDHFCEDPVK